MTCIVVLATCKYSGMPKDGPDKPNVHPILFGYALLLKSILRSIYSNRTVKYSIHTVIWSNEVKIMAVVINTSSCHQMSSHQ